MIRTFLVNRSIADDPSYSHAVAVGDEVFVSGQIAQDHPDWQERHGTIEEETAASLDLCATMLAEAGATLADVVKVSIFMTDLAEFDRMEKVYRTYFAPGRMPARTCVEISRLISGAKLEIECIARRSA